MDRADRFLILTCTKGRIFILSYFIIFFATPVVCFFSKLLLVRLWYMQLRFKMCNDCWRYTTSERNKNIWRLQNIGDKLFTSFAGCSRFSIMEKYSQAFCWTQEDVVNGICQYNLLQSAFHCGRFSSPAWGCICTCSRTPVQTWSQVPTESLAVLGLTTGFSLDGHTEEKTFISCSLLGW